LLLEEADLDMKVIQKYKEYGLEFLYVPEEVQKEIEIAARDFYEKKAAEDAFFNKVWSSVRDFMDAYRETDSLQYPYYK